MNAQDFDLLSEYLDGRLAARERVALEARLAQENDLQAALNDLRLNRRLLQALPVVKPPRNRTFTLSRAQAEQLRPKRRGFDWAALFPTLRAATALATLVFVMVFGADMFGNFNATPTSAPMVAQAPQPQDAALPEVATLKSASEAAPQPPLEYGTGGSETPFTVMAPEGTPAPDAARMTGDTPPVTTSVEMSGAALAPETPTVDMNFMNMAVTTDTMPGGDMNTANLSTLTETPTAETIREDSIATTSVTDSPLRGWTIALGVVALLLFAVTLWARNLRTDK